MSIDQPDRFGAALLAARDVDRFLDALAAGAAMIATADGTVDRAERRALLADASSHPDLIGLPRMRVLERFDDYVEKLSKDSSRGTAEIFAVVESFAGDKPHARKLLDIFADIAGNAASRGALEDLRIVLQLPR